LLVYGLTGELFAVLALRLQQSCVEKEMISAVRGMFRRVAARRCNMLTITRRAGQKLMEAITTRTRDPRKVMRLCMTPSGFGPFDLILDEEGEGDQVVTGEDGRRVLLVGPLLADALDRMVIDCRSTPAGLLFTILPSDPVN